MQRYTLAAVRKKSATLDYIAEVSILDASGNRVTGISPLVNPISTAEEAKRIARLFSAAPLMLEALESVSKYLRLSADDARKPQGQLQLVRAKRLIASAVAHVDTAEIVEITA